MVLASSVHDGPVLDLVSGPSFALYCTLGFYCSTVPWFRHLLLGSRVSVQGFQGILCIFIILELVRFNFWCHFGIFLVPTQVELTTLVLEPKLSGT